MSVSALWMCVCVCGWGCCVDVSVRDSIVWMWMCVCGSAVWICVGECSVENAVGMCVWRGECCVDVRVGWCCVDVCVCVCCGSGVWMCVCAVISIIVLQSSLRGRESWLLCFKYTALHFSSHG